MISIVNEGIVHTEFSVHVYDVSECLIQCQYLTLCILVDFPIRVAKISIEPTIVHCKSLWCISVPEGSFNLSKQCRPRWNAAKCCISSVYALFTKLFVYTKG